MSVKSKHHLFWLLRSYCEANGIDVHEIDSHLSFQENKTMLERRFGTLEKPEVYRRLRRIAQASKGTRRTH